MINYVTGDATNPRGDDAKIIAHIVNDEGKWGSGFVMALSRRDTEPGMMYRRWHREGTWHDEDFGTSPFALGQVQLVAFTPPAVFVANMVAQRGVRHDRTAPRAVQYDALAKCLYRLSEMALTHGPEHVASIHMPRIGCGLGGGTWDEIEPIITSTLISRGIPVTVYDLKGT